jgi:hypothetical protein
MPGGSASTEDFRSDVLRGRNVASFKFALAKSILALAETGATAASLGGFLRFSRELCALAGGRRPVDVTR